MSTDQVRDCLKDVAVHWGRSLLLCVYSFLQPKRSVHAGFDATALPEAAVQPNQNGNWPSIT